jgi:hypothetical protein
VAEQRFTWLHLTDLHVGQDRTKSRWENVVEEQVLDDFARVVAKTGPVDAIFFTGDLTQSGQVTEFQDFDEILAKLTAGLGQDQAPIFLAVPGNHDLSRPPDDSAVVRVLRDNWQGDETVRRNFWADPAREYRKTAASAFKNWSDWADGGIDWTHLVDVRRDAVLPGDFAGSIEMVGLRIGVIGLNTAALQLAGGDYQGRLSLDGTQVGGLVYRLADWVSAHDACFLLTHHDPSWLDDDGRKALYGQIATPGRFIAHLCGHRHEQGRTLISEGGAGSKRILIGRSLFGLDRYGESTKEERRHGYSIGSIKLDEGDRTFRIWPRWDVTQQAGHIIINADQSDTLADDEATELEHLGPSPRLAALTPAPTPAPDDATSEGWLLVDTNFLVARADEATSEDLAVYFDGEDPQWPEIASGMVPQLSSAERILQDLKDSRSSQVTVHLVLGPGGEGKSTALMQVAAALGGIDGWRPLWRDIGSSEMPGRLHWGDLKGQIRHGEALCLLIDDAHEVRAEMESFLSRERVAKGLNSGQSVHIVLCAHKDDWNRLQPRRRERWLRKNIISTVNVNGLERQDAKRIVGAYRASDSLGRLDAKKDDDVLAEQLVQSAVARASTSGESALLGATIEARTGESLEVHVGRILERVSAAGADADVPAYEVYISTSAANALGIHRLSLAVLDAAVGIGEPSLTKVLRLTEAELRVDGLGGNRAIRVRHGSIGRRAATVAFSEMPASPLYASQDQVYRGLGRAVVTIPDFWRSPWSKPIIGLTVSARDANPEAAVAVAEGMMLGAPANYHVRSRLAQTYRETARIGDPVAAATTVADFFREYPTLLTEPLRPLILEWAISSGLCLNIPDHGVRSTWLALWALSDQVADGLLVDATAHYIATVTRGLSFSGNNVTDSLTQRTASVVVAAGKRLKNVPHMDKAKVLAGNMLGEVAVEELAGVFEELSSASWLATSIDFRGHPALPQTGGLTFNALVHIVMSQPGCTTQRLILSGLAF